MLIYFLLINYIRFFYYFFISHYRSIFYFSRNGFFVDISCYQNQQFFVDSMPNFAILSNLFVYISIFCKSFIFYVLLVSMDVAVRIYDQTFEPKFVDSSSKVRERCVSAINNPTRAVRLHVSAYVLLENRMWHLIIYRTWSSYHIRVNVRSVRWIKKHPFLINFYQHFNINNFLADLQPLYVCVSLSN